MENNFYKICLRHMRQNDNVFMFWGANGSGYTKCLENAGFYKETDESNIEFSKQVGRGDFLVNTSIVDKLIQKVRLPIYGENIETYGGKNEFFVLPNTGQVRQELGITILDIDMKGSNDSFKAYFTNTVKEELKYEYSKTHYKVKGKPEHFTEHWYYDSEIEAETRNKAIAKVFNSGDFGLTSIDCTFFDFKKKVTCSRVKNLVFDKWVKT